MTIKSIKNRPKFAYCFRIQFFINFDGISDAPNLDFGSFVETKRLLLQIHWNQFISPKTSKIEPKIAPKSFQKLIQNRLKIDADFCMRLGSENVCKMTPKRAPSKSGNSMVGPPGATLDPDTCQRCSTGASNSPFRRFFTLSDTGSISLQI